MQGRNSSEPALFQMIDLEALVPAEHWLRRIDAVLDLGFVHEAVAERYSAGKGRPSVDPELALRMMLLGTLYSLSDRELCDEVAMHAGMRWFCRLNFHDPVPDHSTLSRLRNERWAENGLFERLFDEVVRQCAEAGLISGRHLSLDGTQVAANASLKSLKPVGPRPTRAEPDEPVEPEDPAEGGRRVREPQPKGAWRVHGEKFGNRTHRSTTDPDARVYRKGLSREARLSYLGNDLIDTKSRVILRRRSSLASGTAERELGLEMVDEVLAKWEELGIAQAPEVLSGDANYGTAEFVAAMLDRGIEPHVPLLAGEEIEEIPTWKRRTHDLTHQRKRAERVRLARARNRVRELHRTRGYQVSRKLRVRNEHIFAEAKERHGLGRSRWRGLWRQQVQMDLTATVQNLKRLAAYVHRRRRGAAAAALPRREANGARSFYESREIHQFALGCLLVIHLKTLNYRRSAYIGSRARRAPSSTGF